jgi:hypothetical protein
MTLAFFALQHFKTSCSFLAICLVVISSVPNCFYTEEFVLTPADWLQGCQLVYFHTQNPNLGMFWRTWEWKMLLCLMTISNIWGHLGLFMANL